MKIYKIQNTKYKMGNSSSNQSMQQNLEVIALKNFNIRVNSYSYPHHGPYHQYIEWCHAQYQLECMPQYCRQGANYRG